MNEPWELTITDAAVLISSRKLGAVELLDSVLQRLDKTESYAQAWAYVDDSGAREAAGAADRLSLAGGSLGPLHGIPLGIKDVIDVRNMPTEAGSGALLGNIARSDAGAVRQLRHSGAVILEKPGHTSSRSGRARLPPVIHGIPKDTPVAPASAPVSPWR